MAFDSFSAFLVMEGHGPYVWTCYAVFFLLIVGLMVRSLRRRETVIRSCRRACEPQVDARNLQSAPASDASFTRVQVSQD